MANPFLVLGGIAIGIITAGFGVLAVPGWVASAQDAAAQNDLGNAVAAQSSAVSQTGKAATNLAALKNGQGLRFEESNGSSLETHSNGANWGLIATSASGAVFGKVSGHGDVFRGADRAALVTDPAFIEAWASAGLPPLTDAASTPAALTYQQRFVTYDGNQIMARSGTNFAMLTTTVPTAGSAGYLSLFLNGEQVLGPITPTSDTDLMSKWASVSDKWASAGFSPVDIRDMYNTKWTGLSNAAELVYYDPRTVEDRISFDFTLLDPMLNSHQYLPTEPSPDEPLNVWAARSTGTSKGAIGVSPEGYSMAAITTDGVTWQMYSGATKDALLNDPIFQRAASSAGLTF